MEKKGSLHKYPRFVENIGSPEATQFLTCDGDHPIGKICHGCGWGTCMHCKNATDLSGWAQKCKYTFCVLKNNAINAARDAADAVKAQQDALKAAAQVVVAPIAVVAPMPTDPPPLAVVAPMPTDPPPLAMVTADPQPAVTVSVIDAPLAVVAADPQPDPIQLQDPVQQAAVIDPPPSKVQRVDPPWPYTLISIALPSWFHANAPSQPPPATGFGASAILSPIRPFIPAKPSYTPNSPASPVPATFSPTSPSYTPASAWGIPPPTPSASPHNFFAAPSSSGGGGAGMAKLTVRGILSGGGGGGSDPDDIHKCKDCLNMRPLDLRAMAFTQFMCGCSGGCSDDDAVVVDLTSSQEEVVVKPEPVEDVPVVKDAKFPNTPAHWTEPSDYDKSNGVHKNKCLVTLDRNSQEFINVEATMRQNFLDDQKVIQKEDNDYHHGIKWNRHNKPPGNYVKRVLKELSNQSLLEIDCIKRVQNLAHVMSHESFKQVLDFQKAPDAVLKGKTVYHGTDDYTAEQIGKDGFNRSFTQAHRYGHGVYFSRGLIAWNHALDCGVMNPSGAIIVSTIAYTKIGQSDADSKRPPDGCDLGGSDSDDNASIFTSFSDNQAIPEYIAYVKYTGWLTSYH